MGLLHGTTLAYTLWAVALVLCDAEAQRDWLVSCSEETSKVAPKSVKAISPV